MDFENNEKKQEETQNQEGFQKEYRTGRSPRPRIHTGQRPTFERPSFNNHDNDEGGFRPEGDGQPAWFRSFLCTFPQRSEQHPEK